MLGGKNAILEFEYFIVPNFMYIESIIVKQDLKIPIQQKIVSFEHHPTVNSSKLMNTFITIYFNHLGYQLLVYLHTYAYDIDGQ